MHRGCLNAKRLEYEASVLASVHGAVRLGHDAELSDLLREGGLGDDAISALRFQGTGSEYSVVLPTDRTWNHARLKGRVLDIGLRASALGRSILIASPAIMRRQPRLGNALHIFHTMMVPACGDLERSTACVDARGGEATLLECQAAVPGRDPRRRIFGLVFGGHLVLDLHTEITDLSTVRLRSRQPDWGWEVLGWCPVQAI
jgi:hypothetical protein